MVCKNWCEVLGTKKKSFSFRPYDKGYKYCCRCRVFYSPALLGKGLEELHHCPCCGVKLRCKVRASHKRQQRRLELEAVRVAY